MIMSQEIMEKLTKRRAGVDKVRNLKRDLRDRGLEKVEKLGTELEWRSS